MNVKQLFADEDAVSPVIGVILMVAITVILAAVIGTFVLGLGENVQDSAPQANFQFEYENTSDSGLPDAMEITHTGGEDVDSSNVVVLTNGFEIYNESAIVNDIDGGGADLNSTTVWSGTISTGDTARFAEDGSSGSATDIIVGGQDVRVIWTSPSGGTSNTIGQSTVPS